MAPYLLVCCSMYIPCRQFKLSLHKPLHAFTIWISCHPFASDVKSLAIVQIVFRLSSLKTPRPRQSFASKLPSKAFSEGAPLSTAKRSLKAPTLPTMAWHQWHQHVTAFFCLFYGVLHRASRASPCLELSWISATSRYSTEREQDFPKAWSAMPNLENVHSDFLENRGHGARIP